MDSKVVAKSRVRLVGLVARPELNGLTGKAIRFLKDRDRWEVRLEESVAAEKSLTLKDENLQVLDPHGDALARTILHVMDKYGGGSSLRRLHIIGATSLELAQEFQPLLTRVAFDFTGTWITEKGNKNTVKDGNITWFDDVVTPVHVNGGTLSMDYDGDIFTATMEDRGKKLVWSDGDFWIRSNDNEELSNPLEVTLVGPALPATYPEGEISSDTSCSEQAVTLQCFRGKYQDFIQVAAARSTSADVIFLSNPCLAEQRGGPGSGFFSWATELHAVAQTAENALCICASVEPFGEGELLADGIQDEQVIRASGFEVKASAQRSSLGIQTSLASHCWYSWAATLPFSAPSQEKRAVSLEVWTWRSYYNARRSRNALPKYRFRHVHESFKPEVLEELQQTQEVHLEKAQQAMKAAQTAEEAEVIQQRLQREETERQESAMLARMEWLARTVHHAWMVGGNVPKGVAAVAGAVAAAEAFADPARARPLPPEQPFVVLHGAGEVAAIQAMRVEGGSNGIASLAVAIVSAFEALVVQALWPGRYAFTPEDVGQCYLQILDSCNVELGSGVASACGERLVDTLSALSVTTGMVSLGKMAHELQSLAAGICECASLCTKESCADFSEAAVDSLDLALAAGGGREAFLRIAHKMADAPAR